VEIFRDSLHPDDKDSPKNKEQEVVSGKRGDLQNITGQ
jgi:hypothetical protein